MAEFASGERGFEGGLAPRAQIETPAPAPRTASEQSQDRVASLTHHVAALAHAIDAVQQATAANDPARWQEAKRAWGGEETR